MASSHNTPHSGETYDQKRERVNRRCEDILTLLRARYLTFDEVKEYFELLASLTCDPAGSSEEEQEEDNRASLYFNWVMVYWKCACVRQL